MFINTFGTSIGHCAVISKLREDIAMSKSRWKYFSPVDKAMFVREAVWNQHKTIGEGR